MTEWELTIERVRGPNNKVWKREEVEVGEERIEMRVDYWILV